MVTPRFSMPDGSVLGTKGVYAPVNGTRIYFEEHGSGEALVLMHGGLESIESLYPQAFTLSQQFRVILPERRGHGRTPDSPGPLSYMQGTDDTTAFLDYLGIERAHLVGYSDGAVIALFMGIHRPERVVRLVSISANYHYSGLSSEYRNKLARLPIEKFERNEEETARIYKQVSPDGPNHLAIMLEKVKRLWPAQPRLTGRDLARIQALVLVMAADRDIISPFHTINLFRSIPHARLAIIPGTSHSLITEAPEEVNRTILTFLSATDV
jgi:pimeloyl-ACP methyl ester carboxylesterase